VPKRRPGPFQPPEVESASDAGKVGRKGDVWSFGCVLTMVLAFALGGRQLVDEFDEVRGPESDPTDYFYQFRSVIVKNHSAQIPEVKPIIIAWLDSLPNRFTQHASWIRRCVDLIKATLTIEQEGRPDSKGVKNVLRDMSTPNLVAESFAVPQLRTDMTAIARAQSIPMPSPRQPKHSVGSTSMYNTPTVPYIQKEDGRLQDTYAPFYGPYSPGVRSNSPEIQWRVSSPRSQADSESASPTRLGHTSRQSSLSINYDRRAEPNLFRDVIVSPEFRDSPPPLETDLSEIESNDHPPSTPNLSRRSTTISLSHAPNVTSVPLKFVVPSDSPLQTSLSPSGDRVVFLSKKCAFVYSLQDGNQGSGNGCPIQIKGTWWRASLSGCFIALLGENNQVVCPFGVISVKVAKKYCSSWLTVSTDCIKLSRYPSSIPDRSLLQTNHKPGSSLETNCLFTRRLTSSHRQ
jgi:hypothetical protein